MRKMLLFLFVVLFVFSGKSQGIKVMLVTGGHAFDTVQFFQMFDVLEGVEYEHFAQPNANKAIAKGAAEEFDVLVFYDMWKDISADQKAAYLKLTKQGKPFLFLHHSIVSYQKWGEFENIVGGKYVQEGKRVPEEKISTYDHDVWLYCYVENHTPITAGISEFRFFDEAYGNLRISDNVKPLLRTKHPKASDYVAWQHVYNKSNIVYLQMGHDKRTFENENFRKLVYQAIKYLAITN